MYIQVKLLFRDDHENVKKEKAAQVLPFFVSIQ